MGIPRFTSLVDNTFTGWQREEITGHLVIDGYSLLHNLYSFDWSHGGQFPEYQGRVSDFFVNLTQSGIEPIVVLDGIDYREEKTRTTMKRRNGAIKTIHKHIANEQKRNIEAVDDILPPLAFTVFVKVMTKLKVKFVVVDGEGDMWIHQLANAYSCPVLSSDSDFLMFKLKRGYVPFNRFHWEASPVNAEVFYYRAFCEQFGFKNESLRLIIPAIAGNDFIQGFEPPRFSSYVAKSVGMDTRGHKGLSNIVKYARIFESLDHFIDKVEAIEVLGSEDKRQLQDNCCKAREMYDCDEATSLEKISKETELHAFNSETLPDWVLEQFREGNFSPIVMEALVVGKSFLHVFIDNTALDSCLHASLPIRQHMYGITGSSLVTELCREGLEVCGKGIHSTESINGRPLPSLDRIPSLNVASRERLLYSILACDEHLIGDLAGHWKLVMATTMYWLQRTNPSRQIVKALILSFMVCYSCPYQLPKMRSHFFIPIKFRRSPQWMGPLHAFAQWQGAYVNAMALNEILMLPLENMSPAFLYDGKLAMFFAYPENDDHQEDMLPIDHALYLQLMGIVLPRKPSSLPPPSHAAMLPPPHQKSDKPPRFQNVPRGAPARPGGRGRGQAAGEPRGRGRGRGRNPPSSLGQRKDQSADSRIREPSASEESKVSSQTQGFTGVKGVAGVSPAKIVVTKPPKFAHANPYAALHIEDELESESDSN